jgi:hypothetical protein
VQYPKTRGVAFPLIQRTATPTAFRLNIPHHRGIFLFLRITTHTTGTLDVSVRAYDPDFNSAITLASAVFAQKMSGNLTDTLEIYPGAASSANRRVGGVLPTWIEIHGVMGTVPDMVWGLNYELIP